MREGWVTVGRSITQSTFKPQVRVMPGLPLHRSMLCSLVAACMFVRLAGVLCGTNTTCEKGVGA
jgi:hypothetical protein